MRAYNPTNIIISLNCANYSTAFVIRPCAILLRGSEPLCLFFGNCFLLRNRIAHPFRCGLGTFFLFNWRKSANLFAYVQKLLYLCAVNKNELWQGLALCARVIFITKEVGPIAFPRAIRSSMPLQRWGLQRTRAAYLFLGLSPRTFLRYACSASCFASVAKQFPKEADELFAAAQENAQWRYKSYLRMLGTAW